MANIIKNVGVNEITNSNLFLDRAQQCMASRQCHNTENIYDLLHYLSTPNTLHTTMLFYNNNNNNNDRLTAFDPGQPG